jgi:hypothetical protein
MSMKVDGACHCGSIAIEGEADPAKVAICHCIDCQTSTGSAFRVSVPVPGASFKITGRPTTYVKTTAESGTHRLHAFCSTCGTPVYATSMGDGVQPVYSLRVGMLRQRDQLPPQKQIWWRSSRRWVTDLAAVAKAEKQR